MMLKNTILGFLFFMIASLAIGQTYSELITVADEQFKQKDYYEAILFYEKAKAIDSNSVELNWKLAESYRLYKDYEAARDYYDIVYGKEQGRIYPYSIFWLATMQQYLGDYNHAKRSFKSAKKVFKTDREAYEYLKSVQSFKACIWAENQVADQQTKVESIGSPVNTADTELAPFVYNNTFYFTALKADSVLESEEVVSKNYKVNIYKADKFKTSLSNVEVLQGLENTKDNYANGTVSADGKRFYFSRCDDNYGCKIFVGELKDGKVTEIDSLGEIINDVAGTTTMPHIALINGKEYLFFVSDRYGTLGGLDIWVSKITDGNQYAKPFNLGPKINTVDHDITPFFNPQNRRLYFSSTWHEGFGGQDIFYAQLIDNNWRFNTPVNLGLPINSSQNDTYYFEDTLTGDFYFSSNRDGVAFTKNPNCCNDIFMVKNRNQSHEIIAKFPDLTTINNRLPTLYFHNDEPNPKTTDTTTKLNYLSTYISYANMQGKYKKEYSKGLIGDEAEEAKEDIEDFFIEYVDKGVNDLAVFTTLLKKELEKGQDLVITVKGFASPLAKSDYNVNLTKRRIASFYNYLSEYESGALVPYLQSGKLKLESIPFGEYTADSFVSDNVNDQKNSVYSRKASLERKIEIQSVGLQGQQILDLKFNKLIHDFGIIDSQYLHEALFELTNQGDDTIQVSQLLNECDCTISSISEKTLAPQQSATIKVKYNPIDDSGLVARRVLIQFSNGYSKTISISGEVAR